jgi:elongator complex protein 3
MKGIKMTSISEAACDETLREFSRQLVSAMRKKKISTRKELNKAKAVISKELGLKRMPTNADILGACSGLSSREKQLLTIKPVRTLSGVAVVAVMVKPHECPGKCLYCPTGIGSEMPKSYTGKEPAAMRALNSGFDPFLQVNDRLEQLENTGHPTGKTELIIMGGSFLAMPASYQKGFVRKCLNALTGKEAESLEAAKKNAEGSARRLVGLTVETRPDYCRKKHVKRMLSLGTTRVEIGVQMPSDEVYRKVRRGHSVKEVTEATKFAKDSGLKVCYHVMPGIYGMPDTEQLELLKEMFKKEEFMPDMLKIYPALVVKGTGFHRLWKKGLYTPLSSSDAASFIAELKASLPHWVRVMRVQRDIPAGLIEAGARKSNLRELVEQKMKENGTECRCIRHREIGIRQMKNSGIKKEKPQIKTCEYRASNGTEFFIEAADRNDSLYGFARLRIPDKPFMPEIDRNTALIRELHVYGTSLPLGNRSAKGVQHTGIGKKLMEKAEALAEEEGMKRIAVISALGTRDYYRKLLGYRLKGAYMCRGV